MAYASILIHVEAQPICEARLALAADLANRFDAALIGIGAEICQPPAMADGIGYVDGQILQAEAELIKDDLARCEARFHEVAKTVRAGSEWGFAVAFPSEMVIQLADTADLIVLGPRKSQSWGLRAAADPGDVLMAAGRPVLVTPPDLAQLDAARVLVAWKNTREARRALTDSLPFLKRASQVTIAEVSERPDDETDARLAHVVQYLARHKIAATSATRARGKATVAEALLEMADLQDCGLLVVGGYGHARLREWAFGGVTEELLAGSHRAVLFSH